jgi:hypothetical protein
MPNYMFAYTGGEPPASEAEGKKVMDAWMAWFGTLGDSVVDGGNPFGPSKTVSSSGKTSDGASTNLTGYSIIRADSFDEVSKFAESCPQLAANGSIEIYETHQVM